MDHGNSDHGAVAHGLGHCGGGHGHGGHVTHEAVMLSFSHGAHDSHGIHLSHAGAHSMFSPHAAVAHQGAVSRQGDPRAQKKQFRDSLKGEERPRNFIVHVSLHGNVDLSKEFERMAPGLDLVRLDTLRPGLDTIDNLKFELSDWDSWDPNSNTGDKPSGNFPGATGSTAFRRQYWQVGKRRGGMFGAPKFDATSNTYLEISWLVWRFDQTGDFDTRLDVRVISIPVWNQGQGGYGIKKGPVDTHIDVAVRICEWVFDLLTGTEPDPASKLLRERINVLYPGHEGDDHDQSIRVATAEENHDADMENLAREKGQDAWARAAQMGDGGAGGGTTKGEGFDSDVESLLSPHVDAAVGKVTLEVPHED